VPSGIVPTSNSRLLWYDETARLVLFLTSQAASPLDAPIFVSAGADSGAAAASGSV
jgi:hypothetical protein